MNQVFKILFDDKKMALIGVSLSGAALASIINIGISVYLNSYTSALPKELEQSTKPITYKLSSKFALANKITSSSTMQNWKLKAIFKYSHGSFIIFEDGTKTVFLGLGESYNGYKLEDMSNDSAKLSNGGAGFELKIDKKNGEQQAIQLKQPDSSPKSSSGRRAILEKYAKNPSQLLDEIKTGIIGEGVIVNYLKPESILADIGIQIGDTLLEINNEKVSNFSTVLSVFKDPEKTKNIKIIVLRQNIRRELNYEIN